jgi:Outer membrane protein beta-barrel domain
LARAPSRFVPQQAAAKVTFNLGVKAGASMSNVSWSDDDGAEKSIIRPTFGLVGVINLSPRFAIQPELDYVTMGEWWEDTEAVDVWKIVENFGYLQIPVLLKVRLVPEGKVAPFLCAGPVLGILLSAHEKEYLNGTLEDDFEGKAFFKSTDFGAAFGGGAEFMVSKLKVFVDIRYHMGFTNVYSFSTKYTMKTRALLVAGGVLF